MNCDAAFELPVCDLSFASLCCLSLIFFLGYFEQQITGFGASLFCLPFSLFFIPKEVFTPIVWAFTFGQSIYIFIRQRKSVDFRQLLISLAFACTAGYVLSVLFIENLPPLWVKLCLALFIAVNSSAAIYKLKTGKTTKGLKLFHYLYPIGSGALQTSFGIGGPLLVAFLTKTIDSKDALRSTLAGYWVFINGFLFFSLAFTSGLPKESVGCGLILTPAVIIGAAAGNTALKKVNHKTFSLLVHIILIASSFLIIL